jgi:ribonuclease P protein component
MRTQGLPAARRIRRRPEFQHAYDAGSRAHGKFMTLIAVPNGQPSSRLGVAATRKIGTAVVRNRAKRLARELFRRHTTSSGLDLVIVPRREMVHAPFANLESDYRSALQRCRVGTARTQPRGPRRNHGAQVV